MYGQVIEGAKTMNRNCTIIDWETGHPVASGVSQHEVLRTAQVIADTRDIIVEYNYSDEPDVWFVVKPDPAYGTDLCSDWAGV